MPATRLGARPRDRPLGVVTALPAEHRAGEDVVEDLPAPASSVRRMRWSARTPTTPRTSSSDAVRELREVGRLVRDLRPRRGDEVVEEPRRDLALLGGQRLDRPLEVVGDDLPGAAELVERRGAERRTSRSTRSTSHSRCMTSWRYGASIPGARPVRAVRAEAAGAELDAAGADAVEHGARRARPRSPRRRPRARSSARAASRSPPGPASRSRRSSRRTFPNRLGIAPFSRSSVASVSSRSESSTLTRSGPSTSVGERRGRTRPPSAVVGEVLLRLVEDRGRRRARPARASTTSTSGPGSMPRGLGERLGERLLAASSLQLEKTTTSGCSGSRAERPRDAREEERRLPHPARAVEDREPRRDEVRDDDLGVALPPEEVERVEVGVLERGEAAVRRRRGSRRRPRAAARGARRTRPGRRRARRRRSGARTPARARVGSGSSAHERYASGRSPQTRCITSRRFQSTISYPMKRKWLRRRCAASATGTDGREVRARRGSRCSRPR